MRRWACFVFAALAGSSCRDLDIPAGGGGGSGPAADPCWVQCGETERNICEDSDHCGACDSKCVTDQCLARECQLAPSSEGAWALAQDETALYWAHPFGGPIYRTDATTGMTESGVAQLANVWEIQADAGIVVVLRTGSGPHWYPAAEPEPTTPDTCGAAACSEATDLAQNGTLLVTLVLLGQFLVALFDRGVIKQRDEARPNQEARA